ncbi:hypothetical protein D515_00267 [Grimontia indica]|uniref:DUF2971 domain-containing protein n=1 Tax=Grimontia indica TaxID=1056512 RepID=R1IT37_9GAMM|nr:DUF2971 domain-containing protein [Grimontia indica]EOD80642.1 hypothetical protein D515_00267 [Grimontia indica]
MGLYKYTTFENVKHLLDGTIRFTQPKAFNDPFELLPEMHISKVLSGFSISVLSPQTEQNLGLIPESEESRHSDDIASRELLDELNSKLGILCLTRNADSLLMWSHYADEYKGVVVEFDEEHEFFTGLFPIMYRKNRPRLDLALLIEKDNVLRVSDISYKPYQWEYENEFRITRSLDDCNKVGVCPRGFDIYTMDIPLECIKGITMGERMPIEQQRYLLSKIQETDVSLGLAAISNKGYTFRPEPIKYNTPLSKMAPTMSPRTAHIFKELNCELGEIARWMIKTHPLSKVAIKTL